MSAVITFDQQMRLQRWFQENEPGPDVAAAARGVADSPCTAPQLHKLIIWVYSCNTIPAGLLGVGPLDPLSERPQVKE